VPDAVTLVRARPEPGRLIAPFSFDPAQLMLWRSSNGDVLLQIDSGALGTDHHAWEVVLSVPVLRSLVGELTAIRENAMSGEWVLGKSPHRIRFTFHGVRSHPTSQVIGNVQESLSDASLSMRLESFESLYNSLVSLMSNNRIERTRDP
jgi:hypothetical protein